MEVDGPCYGWPWLALGVGWARLLSFHACFLSRSISAKTEGTLESAFMLHGLNHHSIHPLGLPNIPPSLHLASQKSWMLFFIKFCFHEAAANQAFHLTVILSASLSSPTTSAESLEFVVSSCVVLHTLSSLWSHSQPQVKSFMMSCLNYWSPISFPDYFPHFILTTWLTFPEYYSTPIAFSMLKMSRSVPFIKPIPFSSISNVIYLVFSNRILISYEAGCFLNSLQLSII